VAFLKVHVTHFVARHAAAASYLLKQTRTNFVICISKVLNFKFLFGNNFILSGVCKTYNAPLHMPLRARLGLTKNAGDEIEGRHWKV